MLVALKQAGSRAVRLQRCPRDFATTTTDIKHMYDHVTEVTRTGDFTFSGNLSDEFCIKGAPNGGYLMGLAMRAASECIAAKDPLATTGYYVDKSTANAPMDIIVELLSVAKSTTTASIRCSQEGQLKCVFTVTYGSLSRMRGLTQVNLSAPKLPPVSQCIDAMAAMRAEIGKDMSIANQIELRLPPSDEFVQTTLLGRQGTVATLSGWGSFAGATVDGGGSSGTGPPRPPCLSSLCQLSDCFPPPVLNVARFGWIPTLEYTVHYWNHPSVADIGNVAHLEGLSPGHPDYHQHWVRYTASTSFLQNSMCYLDNEVWSPCGGFLLATSRQLARVMIPSVKPNKFG
jgi:hypothetical protein